MLFVLLSRKLSLFCFAKTVVCILIVFRVLTYGVVSLLSTYDFDHSFDIFRLLFLAMIRYFQVNLILQKNIIVKI